MIRTKILCTIMCTLLLPNSTVFCVISREWPIYEVTPPDAEFPMEVTMKFVNKSTEPFFVIARHENDSLEEELTVDPFGEATYTFAIPRKSDTRKTWVFWSFNESLVNQFATTVHGNTKRNPDHIAKTNKAPLGILHFVPKYTPPSAETLIVLDDKIEDLRSWRITKYDSKPKKEQPEKEED